MADLTYIVLAEKKKANKQLFLLLFRSSVGNYYGECLLINACPRFVHLRSKHDECP